MPGSLPVTPCGAVGHGWAARGPQQLWRGVRRPGALRAWAADDDNIAPRGSPSARVSNSPTRFLLFYFIAKPANKHTRWARSHDSRSRRLKSAAGASHAVEQTLRSLQQAAAAG